MTRKYRKRILLPFLLLLPTLGLAGGTEYRIDTEQSWLRILVYRAGLMSGLGHNHTVSAHDLSGELRLHDPETESTLNLAFAVEDLIVDDPADRDAEGDDFPGHIKDKDIRGTRKNMLGRKLLDASNHPRIEVVSTSITDADSELLVNADVHLQGRTHEIVFPVSVERLDGTLKLTGSAEISHKSLGLKRFSAALGALKVRETFVVKFELIATTDDSH